MSTEIVRHKEEIEIIDASDRLRHYKTDYDYDTLLRYATRDQEHSSVKKLSIRGIFSYYKFFPRVMNKTVERLLHLLGDEDVEVRKQVAGKIGKLCTGGQYVEQVCDVLSQLICTAEDQELSLVGNTLSKLITEYPRDAILAVLNAIQAANNDSERLIMIKYLDIQLSKIGTIQEGMRTHFKKLFEEMLGRCSSPTQVSTVLGHASTTFFQTKVEKSELVSKIKIMLDPLNSTEANPDEVVDVFVNAADWSTWSGGVNSAAQYLVRYFLENIDEISKLDRMQQRCISRAAAQASWRKREFVHLPAGFKTNGYNSVFLQFLDLLPLKADETTKRNFLETVDLEMIEAHLLFLYNLMPEFNENSGIWLERAQWRLNFNTLSSLLREQTGIWRDRSATIDNNDPDMKTYQMALRMGNNIGIMLLEFLQATPRRRYEIKPSWLKNYKLPSLKRQPKSEEASSIYEVPARRVLRKRQRSEEPPRRAGRPRTFKRNKIIY